MLAYNYKKMIVFRLGGMRDVRSQERLCYDKEIGNAKTEIGRINIFCLRTFFIEQVPTSYGGIRMEI